MLSSAPLMHPVVRRWLDDARSDPVGFWERAAEDVPWFRRWDRAFEWTFPTFRWFIGAETNLAWNALDHHVAAGRGGHAAIAYFNERGERRVLTYAQLLHQVRRASAALRALGVRRGDRITIYMPTAPEAIVLMLAIVRLGDGHDSGCERMESNEPAFILATSGTTASPKLAVHTHGGYQVHIVAMARWCYAMTRDDVWWATSDIGWIVGHSYIVYAPLVIGCTTVVFEGALDFPVPDANWRAAIEEFGTTGIFTSPTAVRMLMRYGDDSIKHVDYSRLERIFCAGEALNPPAWEWLQNHTLRGKVPVIDHMWQTETAGPVFGNPLGIGLLPIKPGSAGIPLAGIEAAVVRADGTACE